MSNGTSLFVLYQWSMTIIENTNYFSILFIWIKILKNWKLKFLIWMWMNVKYLLTSIAARKYDTTRAEHNIWEFGWILKINKVNEYMFFSVHSETVKPGIRHDRGLKCTEIWRNWISWFVDFVRVPLSYEKCGEFFYF